MSNKIDDFDFDMSDITGGTEKLKSEETIIAEPPPELVEEVIEGNDYESVLARINKHCDKEWISVPTIKNGKLHTQTAEVKNCSPELFVQWLEYMYPPSAAKDVDGLPLHTPEQYEDPLTRQRAWIEVVTFYKYLKFPDMEYIPQHQRIEKDSKDRKKKKDESD